MSLTSPHGTRLCDCNTESSATPKENEHSLFSGQVKGLGHVASASPLPQAWAVKVTHARACTLSHTRVHGRRAAGTHALGIAELFSELTCSFVSSGACCPPLLSVTPDPRRRRPWSSARGALSRAPLLGLLLRDCLSFPWCGNVFAHILIGKNILAGHGVLGRQCPLVASQRSFHFLSTARFWTE